ncbi:putative Long chain acyl-CoA synthetase 7, peroxisomal [Blattamonas nauphoetae]|uniref:Long chain acyl-CoA synthetase 7, peroxisomal n=1 Tax=Blattamonas nauphoetae TaxID=2049346 RepID=A0ABQ9Y2M0_9EUKA|nr:putative Long chain acyl-CoA synthetase 7, peroxisomal [Blattamonas nauphoetae]
MSEPAENTQPQESTEVQYSEVWGNPEIQDTQFIGMTTYQALEATAQKYPERRAIGGRTFLENGERGEYEWISFPQMITNIKQLALGMKELGLKKGDSVGIMLVNRPEWPTIDYACSSQGYILVPIYDSYGPISCEYIIRTTNCKLIFTQPSTVPFLKEASMKCDCVNHIVVLDTTPQDLEFVNEMEKKEATEENGIEVRGYNKRYTQVFASGKEKLDAEPTQRVDEPECNYDDTFTIVYTSGTTSLPKGACLSHRTMNAARRSLASRMITSIYPDNIVTQDTYMSYLPLAHILERNVEFFALTNGDCVGYFSGSMAGVVKDLGVLKPTVTAVVPRVLSKIYAAVTANIAKKGFFARMFVKRAMDAKGKEQITGKPMSNFLKNILANVEATFGGRLRVIFNGSAPVNPTIAEFLSRCMHCRIWDGYGITELGGVCCAQQWTDRSFGNSGFILGDVLAKVKSHPELGYTIDSDPMRGEICLKGEAVFQHYYKDEEATKRAKDEDGWYHTGDIVEVDKEKRVSIIERVKNVFKLQQGEFVHVEDIEAELSTSKLIAQCMVHGTMQMTNLAAIVVPVKPAVLEWAKTAKVPNFTSTGNDDTDFEALCKTPEVNTLLLKDIRTILLESHRKGYETPKMIHVTPVEFNVENGQTTPTMKFKREKIREAYKQPLEEMEKLLSK